MYIYAVNRYKKKFDDVNTLERTLTAASHIQIYNRLSCMLVTFLFSQIGSRSLNFGSSLLYISIYIREHRAWGPTTPSERKPGTGGYRFLILAAFL